MHPPSRNYRIAWLPDSQRWAVVETVMEALLPGRFCTREDARQHALAWQAAWDADHPPVSPAPAPARRP